jgi:hypothetical protein
MSICGDNIKNSIASAGFHNDYNAWHIAKHDIDTGDV